MTVSPDTFVDALEAVASRAWPPTVRGQLGEWRLHASEGFSGRANACWPIGAPDRPLAPAIQAVEAWYAATSLPPLFKIVDVPSTGALRDRLADQGYVARTETLTMVGPLAATPSGETARVFDAVDPDFITLFNATSTDPRDAAERLDTLARIARPRGFASILMDGAPAAAGACAIEGEWAGVFGMRTAPAYRRRGLARAIIASLSSLARGAGAQKAYLQVEAGNAPAIALYVSLGFAEAYRYRYWAKV